MGYSILGENLVTYSVQKKSPMRSPRKMKRSGGSTLSAKRSKKARVRKTNESDTSSDSSEHDIEKSLKKVEARQRRSHLEHVRQRTSKQFRCLLV